MKAQFSRRRTGLAHLACAFCLAAATLFTTTAARADDVPTSDKWMFQLTPYLWLASLSGTVGVSQNLPTMSLDASFGDIFQNLDAGIMAIGTARKGRFVALTDISYVSLSADSDGSTALLGSAHANAKSFNSTIEGGYQVVQSPHANVDLLGGLRVFSVQNTIDFSGGILSARSAESSDTWVDPVIGVNANAPLGSGFSLNGYFDFGGFGIDGDWTWQIYAGGAYDISDMIRAYAGYRYLDVHHENDGFIYDVSQQGPMLGLGIRF